jgi:hypothetical protein
MRRPVCWETDSVHRAGACSVRTMLKRNKHGVRLQWSDISRPDLLVIHGTTGGVRSGFRSKRSRLRPCETDSALKPFERPGQTSLALLAGASTTTDQKAPFCREFRTFSSDGSRSLHWSRTHKHGCGSPGVRQNPRSCGRSGWQRARLPRVLPGLEPRPSPDLA